MEIKFENINLKNKNKYLVKDLNFVIKDNEITGIIDNSKIIKQIFSEKMEDINFLNNKKIKYVEHNFLTKTVSDEFFLIKKEIDDSNYIEKISASLDLVGLDESYLTKEINSLSNSEKTLLEIALSIISNPDIIIFDNVFTYLDKKYKTIIKKLLIELKRKYKKMVIIIDKDINILYEICTYLLIFNDNKLLVDCPINDAFNNLEIYDNNEQFIPFLVDFSNIAKNYSQNIKNYKSINDLIKEVYKNVK